MRNVFITAVVILLLVGIIYMVGFNASPDGDTSRTFNFTAGQSDQAAIDQANASRIETDAAIAAQQAAWELEQSQAISKDTLEAERARLLAELAAKKDIDARNSKFWWSVAVIVVLFLLVTLSGYALWLLLSVGMEQTKRAISHSVSVLPDGSLLVQPSPYAALVEGDSKVYIKPKGLAVLIAAGDKVLPDAVLQMGLMATMLPEIAQALAGNVSVDDASVPNFARLQQLGDHVLKDVLEKLPKK